MEHPRPDEPEPEPDLEPEPERRRGEHNEIGYLNVDEEASHSEAGDEETGDAEVERPDQTST